MDAKTESNAADIIDSMKLPVLNHITKIEVFSNNFILLIQLVINKKCAFRFKGFT